MQVRRPLGLQGCPMKPIATRSYTFQELMNRIDLEYWRVRRHSDMSFTFIPLQYWGGD